MRHQRTVHGIKVFTFDSCEASFKRADHLQRQARNHVTEKQHQCHYFSCKFHLCHNFNQHLNICSVHFNGGDCNQAQQQHDPQLNQQGAGAAERNIESNQREEACDEVSALDNNLKVLKLYPRVSEKGICRLFLFRKIPSVLRNLERELRERQGIKYYLCCKVRLVKQQRDGEEVSSDAHFRSLSTPVTNIHELRQQVQEAIEKIKKSFLEYMKEGSG